MIRVVYVRITLEGKQEIKFSNRSPSRTHISAFLDKEKFYTYELLISNSRVFHSEEDRKAVEFLGGVGTKVILYHTDRNAGSVMGGGKSKNTLASSIRYSENWDFGIRGNAIIEKI